LCVKAKTTEQRGEENKTKKKVKGQRKEMLKMKKPEVRRQNKT
jgi:hypothetical protein